MDVFMGGFDGKQYVGRIRHTRAFPRRLIWHDGGPGQRRYFVQSHEGNAASNVYAEVDAPEEVSNVRPADGPAG